MEKFLLFTLGDFSKHDGSTVRMHGIVNALSKYNNDITFCSNVVDREAFESGITHINTGVHFSKRQKQLLQLSIALLPVFLVRAIYFRLIRKIDRTLKKHLHNVGKIIFFDYFDNSLAYLLFKSNVIPHYINDIHGIAPLEFKLKTGDTFLEKLTNRVKYHLAKRIDHKVFTSAKGCIFVSSAMADYFLKEYPSIRSHLIYIVRDGVNPQLCQQPIDESLLATLKEQYNIHERNKVILFIGEFKELGGVIDLINAFRTLHDRFPHARLMLIGDGEELTKAKTLVDSFSLQQHVVFTGRILYHTIRTYQTLANVIVCPDKMHPFSEMVPHIKYFDALASGKIVINGRFRCIHEINGNEKYSLDFVPSNVESLARTIEKALLHEKTLLAKYAGNTETVCRNFTYDSSIEPLLSESAAEKIV